MSQDRRGPDRPLSVAPMMDRTDRHCRYFMRRLTRRTLLYTEMVTTWAILQGDRERLLGFDPEEKPLALQLGGDDPRALARCARIAEDLGYDEINLNVGCPSDRVQKGRFGACLMAEPQLVADAVAAMRAAVALPVTVKHRIGIDDLDRYEDLRPSSRPWPPRPATASRSTPARPGSKACRRRRTARCRRCATTTSTA